MTPDDPLSDFDPWILDLEPAVTAFVNFSAPWEGRRRTTPAETIDAIADGLSSWCRQAGAATIAHRGTSTFVIDGRDAARELRASPASEDMYGLWQILEAPRRARLVNFAYKAKAALQVVDETSTAAESLPDLLEGLRVVAPYVDYAWVRRATPLIPNERDVRGRQPTAIEDWRRTAVSCPYSRSMSWTRTSRRCSLRNTSRVPGCLRRSRSRTSAAIVISSSLAIRSHG